MVDCKEIFGPNCAWWSDLSNAIILIGMIYSVLQIIASTVGAIAYLKLTKNLQTVIHFCIFAFMIGQSALRIPYWY